ncbi:terminase large subunit domain-containing protein [Streptomyces scabiei]|uniref:terminase large subunit domain-containing protein n=1 Tax=Streptomyces scabiei TaxID=1930 RepID=UPI0039F0D5C5
MTTDSTTWRPPTEYAEQLQELYGLDCPPLWGTPRRLENPTLGGKAAAVMKAMGFTPMPWQRYVLDVALELDPVTGVFVHRRVGLSVPRQQGKTEQLLAVMIHRTMAYQRARVMYAAQNRVMARERFEDEFWEKIKGSKLAPRFRVRLANGNEAIICKETRSKLGITSNTEKSGHGPSLDLGLIDEAFAHEDDRQEQAMSPAMITKPMAQLWWASAGGTEKGVWLLAQRMAGRALIQELWKTREFPGIAYFEWYAPETMDRGDPATWRFCMPALGHTVTEATIRAEYNGMKPEEFDRAYLNRTRKKTPPADPNIPAAQWPGLVEEETRPRRQVALAVDVAQDRSHTSIGVASLREDGRLHLELVDYRPGTDWAVPALKRLTELWKPAAVAIGSTGTPAGSLIDDIVAAGITTPEDKDKPHRGHLVVVRTNDFVEACGQIADAMTQGSIAPFHQAELTGAVTGARTRRVGDAWAIDRTASLTDASPFVAVTLARWALLTRGPLVQDDYDPVANVW